MDQDVNRIPIPSEIPMAIDTSLIPKEVLRTGAVESLISQNEDLMARIKVLIRRQSSLENQLADSEKIKTTVTENGIIYETGNRLIQMLFEKMILKEVRHINPKTSAIEKILK